MKPQIILLHFAGGNKYSYNFLTPLLEEDFECFALELPGRGKRFGESLITSKKEAIEDYWSQIQEVRNEAPFILFGHSMGANLSYELAARLEDANDSPMALVVTGNAGPNVKRHTIRYNLNEEDFIQTLTEMGGTPQEVIENEELFQLFNPILRADFEVVENPDVPSASGLKHTPVHAIMGAEEEFAKDISNWKNYSEKNVKTQLMEGGHFFIHDHVEKLAQLLINVLEEIPV